MHKKVREFNDYRQKMNDKIIASDNKIIKRIFNLDTKAFKKEYLPLKTKELLGLVASAVFRCDNCVQYHLESSYKLAFSKKEMMETMSIANLIGGTIMIPHLRKALEYWGSLEESDL